MTGIRVFAAVLLGLCGLSAGCGRGASSNQGYSTSPNVARDSLEGAKAYEVKCEKICDVQIKAASLDALCRALEPKASELLGQKTSCVARKPFGAIVDGSLAVKDATILDLSAEGARVAMLALQTQTGWVVARELGAVKTGTVTLVASRPVDITGLEPAAFQLRISIAEGDKTTERLFACGLSGDGAVRCPLSLMVAQRENAQPVAAAAGVAAAVQPKKDTSWLVDVDLTPQGYVATSVKGDAPRGLVGEHDWKTE